MGASKKNLQNTMRNLHRDIGFFLIGLVVLYSLSGVLLIYRDTDFLKTEQLIETTMAPNLEEQALARELKTKRLIGARQEGDQLLFKGGSYNRITGEVSFRTEKLPQPLEMFVHLHKAPSEKAVSWLTTLFGALLAFMAISSFWMFRSSHKQFKRGMVLATSGFCAAVLMVVL
jgi:hypothetical protein